MSQLSYETCKQLKEVGFPQKYHYNWQGLYFYIDQDATPQQRALGEHKIEIPTLEELIEACEKIKQDIVIWFNGQNWSAGIHKYSSKNYIDDYPNPNEEGASVLEVVANLYLALKNEKNA